MMDSFLRQENLRIQLIKNCLH